MQAVDTALSAFGLRSQRLKTAFLRACGVSISQQHYSTILNTTKARRWTGGEKASLTILRMKQLVINVSPVRQWYEGGGVVLGRCV